MSEFDDKPIESPKEDKFGFKPLAETIASSISKMTSPEGTVIAINGPWGSGKSSFINLVRHHLDNSSENDELTIVDFKCWWFRGEEALTIAFFRELCSSMDLREEETKKAISQLGAQLLTKGSPLVGAVTNAFVPGAGSTAAGLTEFLASFIQQDETIEELHEKICETLRSDSKRYLIIIDDIDRLSPDEALLIFRLVKSVGGLPNVMYLLAYDRQIAEKIVADRYPSEGPHFLEKIVQASFDLPEPTKLVLRDEYLRRACPSIIENKYRVNESRFKPLFDTIIGPEMKTPRDLLKILNPLVVTWSAVKGYVDVADFLCIETLRVKRPWLYHALRSNKADLTKITPSTSLTVGEHPHAQRFDHTFLEREFQAEKPELAAERERLRRGLMLLFPALAHIWPPIDHGEDSPDVCD